MTTRADCLRLDADDPLASLRDLFELPAGVIYLDGNSWDRTSPDGARKAARCRVRRWGRGLIRAGIRGGWTWRSAWATDRAAGWRGTRRAYRDRWHLGQRVQGVERRARARARSAPGDAPRRVIVSEQHNFPTDLYIAQSFARERELELRLVESHEIASALDAASAILL
jgi:kynureninase